MLSLSAVSCFQDVADLVEECEGEPEALQESKASVRLGQRVEAMLNKLDHTLRVLESEYVADKDGQSSVGNLEEHQ